MEYTSSHLRNAIDRGRLADQAPRTDPAAAPASTDEEAGGARVSAQNRPPEARSWTVEEHLGAAGPDETPAVQVEDKMTLALAGGVGVAVLVGVVGWIIS